MSYTVNLKFSDYLRGKITEFKPNCTYVIITPYLDEDSIFILSKLKRRGILIKIIDVSTNDTVTCISGVEKINYKGEM
ncbi:hypothetical protein [Clostridium sp.]|uniref:hypothetical protein n=1 Tax=Clostridium sp. TaxID=1506 RepID=UPI003F4C5654